MYRCSFCLNVVPPRTSCHSTVVEMRKKFYPPRSKVNPGFVSFKGKKVYPLRVSKKNQDRVDDPGGTGWEVVVQLPACPKCAKEHQYNHVGSKLLDDIQSLRL